MTKRMVLGKLGNQKQADQYSEVTVLETTVYSKPHAVLLENLSTKFWWVYFIRANGQITYKKPYVGVAWCVSGRTLLIVMKEVSRNRNYMWVYWDHYSLIKVEHFDMPKVCVLRTFSRFVHQIILEHILCVWWLLMLAALVPIKWPMKKLSRCKIEVQFHMLNGTFMHLYFR